MRVLVDAVVEDLLQIFVDSAFSGVFCCQELRKYDASDVELHLKQRLFVGQRAECRADELFDALKVPLRPVHFAAEEVLRTRSILVREVSSESPQYSFVDDVFAGCQVDDFV